MPCYRCTHINQNTALHSYLRVWVQLPTLLISLFCCSCNDVVGQCERGVSSWLHILHTTQCTLNECVCVLSVCESSLSARGVKCRSGNLKNTTAVVFSLLLGTICPSQNKLFMYLFWSKTVDFYMLTAEARHVLCSVLWLSGKTWLLLVMYIFSSECQLPFFK